MAHIMTWEHFSLFTLIASLPACFCLSSPVSLVLLLSCFLLFPQPSFQHQVTPSHAADPLPLHPRPLLFHFPNLLMHRDGQTERSAEVNNSLSSWCRMHCKIIKEHKRNETGDSLSSIAWSKSTEFTGTCWMTHTAISQPKSPPDVQASHNSKCIALVSLPCVFQWSLSVPPNTWQAAELVSEQHSNGSIPTSGKRKKRWEVAESCTPIGQKMEGGGATLQLAGEKQTSKLELVVLNHYLQGEVEDFARLLLREVATDDLSWVLFSLSPLLASMSAFVFFFLPVFLPLWPFGPVFPFSSSNWLHSILTYRIPLHANACRQTLRSK